MNELSWVQILSRTSVLPEPQMMSNQQHLFFSLDKISLIALHTIEFYRNIGNLQSMKGRMMVKWNWRKSRIIFSRENQHLVYLFIYLFKQITLWEQKLRNHHS